MIEAGAGGGNRQQDVEAMLSNDDSFAHFLKDSMPSTSPKTSPKKKKQNILKDRSVSVLHMGEMTHEGVDENLGENFEETPWLPPSVEKAEEFRKKSIYHGGNMRIASLSLVSAPDLGSGTTLYFQFVITMSMCLIIMSVLSLPSLVFIYNGTGMKQEDQDAFGLYRYTLGNIGAQDYSLAGSRCTTGSYAYNDTCIHYGESEISITDASIVMTAMEWVQIFVFFAGIIYLQRKSFSVTGRVSKSQTMISDYTVEVKNIPSDTKDWQLLQHFSELYALNKVDWKGRAAVIGSYPVANVGNTNNPMHTGTWVAECTLHKGIGPFISSFKDKQHLMERLYRCRAQMKMYAENSPHEGGHKLNHYLTAEQRMLHTGMLIDKLTENTIKKKKLKIIINTDEEQGAGSRSPGKPTTPSMKHGNDNQISNPSSIYRNIDAPAVSCYITFQYSESRARCIEDYDRYNSLPYSLFYPPALMFRGNKIRVVKAPEPDQIVWENLELSASAKFYKRARTAIITIALVILCFIVILQASIYKNLFSNKIPDKYVCETAIPTLYANKSTSVNINNMVLTRPPSEQRIAQDTICTQAVANSFYAVYTINGDLNNIVGEYSIDACSVVGFCPQESASKFCPCVSTSSKQMCYPQGCSADDDGGLVACLPFEASAVGICYCYDALSNGLSANGVVATMQTLDTGSGGDESCKSFYSDYVLSVGLTYASVATTTIANFFLRTYLKVLAKQEAHTSSDKEQGSIMSKTFQSSFVMMAVIVLIAYGSSSRTPYFLRQLHIFVGPYDDFTRAWYGNIGFYLMTTFIIQSFSPLVYNLFMYFVGKPMQRFYHHAGVRKRTSTSVVMQHDLNMLEVGPVFDSTVHTAQLLTLLFFSMTFAAGLPLLMPLCAFAFLLYFNIDKYLLCRFYQKPPQLGDAAIKIVIKALPYAAVIRLAIACWMFGNTQIIPDEDSSAGQAATLNHLREEGGANGVTAKLFRENTFPLFILILLIVAAKLIILFFEYFPLVWICKFCFIVLRESSAKNRLQRHHKKEEKDGESLYTVHPWELVKTGDVNRQQVAPFTGEYMRFVKHKDEIPDTCVDMCSYAYLTNIEEAEQEEGWEMRNSGDYVIKVKVFTEVKKKSQHKRGDLKKTYEVVADHRCATYNIEKIPEYVIPMQGLREGTLSMMENQIRALQDKNVVESMLYDTFDAGNMESNVIANYNKRKTLKPGETMPVAHTKLLQAALFEEDDEDEEDDEYPDNSTNKAKPVPTQAKNGHAIAVENPADSFYFAPPTPQTAPPSHGSTKGRGVPSAPIPNSIAAITTNNNKVKYGAPPPSTPAYLVAGEDDGAAEEHKPYFPKSRSQGASSDPADDYSGGHKPYYPARSGDHSDDSSGHKKKKDKYRDKEKNKKDNSGSGKRDYELPPVIASRPSPPAVIQAYSFEEDESDFLQAPDGKDFDDEGGVGGLV